jgi:hypothetical protein
MARASRHPGRIKAFSKSARPGIDKPLLSIHRTIADEFVRLGKATRCDAGVVLIGAGHEILLSCGQAQAYESFGIEPHPVIVQGGLTRTEHQPSAIKF